jgi:hypothetical protein
MRKTMVNRLVAVEFMYPDGYRLVLLSDPLTGNLYVPKVGWVVTGENLEEMFDLVLLENNV